MCLKKKGILAMVLKKRGIPDICRNNKVGIGAALSELSKELGRARKAKELQ